MDTSSLRSMVIGAGAAASAFAAYFAFQKLNEAPKVDPTRKVVKVEYLPNSPVVVLDYNDLIHPNVDLSEPLRIAYGYDGLGLLTVRNVPEFVKRRQALLPLAHKFANLPDSVKEKYVDVSSQFSFGWSHGKEQFNGKPDLAKGSYYNNPLFDRPFDDEKAIAEYASFAAPNIWPKAELPELEYAFKDLGRLIIDVGTLLSMHCDKYVKSLVPTYQEGRLTRVVRTGRAVKARLLHYFPCDSIADDPWAKVDEADLGSWCGFHNDHGSLTGLCSAMYLDPTGKEVPCPDPKAGLYVRSRKGELIKAGFPADHLAFQMGETEQIHSGGILLATPHCVRAATGPAAKGISRETFAVFMEPIWDEPMDIPKGLTPDDALRGTSRNFLPKGVPELGKRWKVGDDFGQFTKRSLKEYTIY